MFSLEEKQKLINDLVFRNKRYNELLENCYSWGDPGSFDNPEAYIIKKRITCKYLKKLYDILGSTYKVSVSSYIDDEDDKLYFKVHITVNEIYGVEIK